MEPTFTDRTMPEHVTEPKPWHHATPEEEQLATSIITRLTQTKQGGIELLHHKRTGKIKADSVLLIEPHEGHMSERMAFSDELLAVYGHLYPEKHLYVYHHPETNPKININQSQFSLLDYNTHIPSILDSFDAILMHDSSIMIDALIRKIPVHTTANTMLTGRGLTFDHHSTIIAKEPAPLEQLAYFYYWHCSKYYDNQGKRIDVFEFFNLCHLAQINRPTIIRLDAAMSVSTFLDMMMHKHANGKKAGGTQKAITHGLLEEILPTTFTKSKEEILNPSYLALPKRESNNVHTMLTDGTTSAIDKRDWYLFLDIKDRLIKAIYANSQTLEFAYSVTETQPHNFLLMISSTDDEEDNLELERLANAKFPDLEVVSFRIHEINNQSRANHLFNLIFHAKEVATDESLIGLVALLLNKPLHCLKPSFFSGFGFTQDHFKSKPRTSIAFHRWFTYVFATNAIYFNGRGNMLNIVTFLKRDKAFHNASRINKLRRLCYQVIKRFIIDEF